MKKLYWIAWPSFLVAGVAEVVFFALVNPGELFLLGEPIELSAIGTYTIGFFLFWAFCFVSSLATCFFQKSSDDINSDARRMAGRRPA
ncbi:MAG TPA: hypothetical protein VF816_04515 [Rhodocyclaceae bacterium]